MHIIYIILIYSIQFHIKDTKKHPRYYNHCLALGENKNIYIPKVIFSTFGIQNAAKFPCNL